MSYHLSFDQNNKHFKVCVGKRFSPDKIHHCMLFNHVGIISSVQIERVIYTFLHFILHIKNIFIVKNFRIITRQQ